MVSNKDIVATLNSASKQDSVSDTWWIDETLVAIINHYQRWNFGIQQLNRASNGCFSNGCSIQTMATIYQEYFYFFSLNKQPNRSFLSSHWDSISKTNSPWILTCHFVVSNCTDHHDVPPISFFSGITSTTDREPLDISDLNKEWSGVQVHMIDTELTKGCIGSYIIPYQPYFGLI